MNKFTRAKKLYQSDYGREFGWYIEYKGEVVGELTNPHWNDMFWFSYDVISINKEKDKILYNPQYWENIHLKFRNKEIFEYAENAFCGGYSPYIIDNRISMRALNLNSTFIESILISLFALLPKKKKQG